MIPADISPRRSVPWRGAAILVCVGAACVAPSGDSSPEATQDAVSPRLSLAIGENGNVGEPYAFSGIADVKASRDGRIYVLDHIEHVVKLYDRDGRHIASFGRRGSGPGEFRYPQVLAVTDSGVHVRDHVGRWDVMFTASGVHVRTSTDSLSRNPAVSLRHGHTIRFHRAHTRTDTGYTSTGALVLAPAGSARLDTLARFQSGDVMWQSAESIGLVSAGIGDAGAWALSGDSLIAVVDGHAGMVIWYAITPSGTSVSRTLSIGRRGAQLTSAERDAIEDRVRKASPGARLLGSIPRQRSVADSAMFDHESRLWVRAPIAEDSAVVWTVFPQNGASFVARFPRSVVVRSVMGNLVYASAESDSGTPVVRVYSIER